MLDHLDPEDFSDHDAWFTLMQACHHATACSSRVRTLPVEISWAILPTCSFAHRQCGPLFAHCANLTERVFCDVGSHLLTYQVLTPLFVTQSRKPLHDGSVTKSFWWRTAT
jgi:hypothetical protein